MLSKLPEYNKKMIDKPGDVPVAVCDYIAGMTDHFAIEKYTEIFIPKFFMQKIKENKKRCRIIIYRGIF